MNSQMHCPHCGTDAVFEATEDYTYRPTIERWEFDNPVNQAEGLKCICTSCDMFVTLDVRNRHIKADKPKQKELEF